jgi:hypothetical protein
MRGDRLQAVRVGQRREEADQDRVASEALRLLLGGRSDLDDGLHVPGCAERRPRLLVGRVGDAGAVAGARLDHDLMAGRGELAHDVGHERDAALAGGRLGGDADPQGRQP